MMPPDEVRLRHMLEAGLDISIFTADKSRSDFESDRLLALGVTKSIEIIGEAASRILPETRSQLSRVPWEKIIAMRNRLIHVYYEIDADILWETATRDVPILVREIQSFLPPIEGENP